VRGMSTLDRDCECMISESVPMEISKSGVS